MYLLIIILVKALSMGKLLIFVISLGFVYLILCGTTLSVLAESIDTSADNTQLPASLSGPVYATVITGYVVDENGNGVSNAVVTLLQNGGKWQFAGKIHYAPRSDENPQISGIDHPGSFTFGEVVSGNYTVTAEKDGFTGSKDFYVSSDTGKKITHEPLRFSETAVNVSLKGYKVPVFNSTQISYTGAITGSVYDGSHGLRVANVTLWQSGQMLKVPKNPQRSLPGTYQFEHIPPGQYEVRAEACDVAGNWHNSSISVTVVDTPVQADVVLSTMAGSQLPPNTPTPAPSPDNTSEQPDSTTPFPETGDVLLAITIAALIVGLFHRPKE